MKTKNLKEQGITLVALVVTIIILLILAGVTINIALRENGLFKMTRTGANKYEQSAINEQTDLDKITEEIDNIVGSSSSGTGQGSGGETGEVVGANEVSNNLKNYQGKYVDIGVDIDGQESTTNDWEIFYVNENRIFLIAADYVPTDTLENAWGVIGSDTKLDGGGFKKHDTYQYGVYWPSAPTSFFNELADLSLVKHTGYDLNANNGKTNSKAVSQLLDTEAWSGIKSKASKNDCIDFVTGGPTLEMWCAAWNEAVEGDTNGFVTIEPDPQTTGTEGTGYRVKHDATSYFELYMNGKTGSLTADQLTALENTYKTFFPHTGDGIWNNCYSYWLASPRAGDSADLMCVEYNGSVTSGWCKDGINGVRPLICLQSGVQLTETSKGSNIYNVSMK